MREKQRYPKGTKPDCIMCGNKKIVDDLFYNKRSHFCTKSCAANYAAYTLNKQMIVWNSVRKVWERINFDLGGDE